MEEIYPHENAPVVFPAELIEALADRDHNMLRCRPFDGQAHTDKGVRGKTEVKGLTFRDLRDCFIRAVFLSSGPGPLYQEALKGERACLCAEDLYGWDLDQLDPMAIQQNLACEVERIMGIFPNIPRRGR